MVDRTLAFRRGWGQFGGCTLPNRHVRGDAYVTVPQVVSSRRGLIIEGTATFRSVGILYRAVLLPLSEDGNTIDHVFGATNYRSLRSHEVPTTQTSSRTHLL